MTDLSLSPYSADAVYMIARVTHGLNKVWCEFNNDASQTDWVSAPQWQRDSAVAGVLFHLNNPGAGDSASHDEWSRVKVAEGWTYGEAKDPEAKTHPCLVPFEELPPHQQFKDRLFRSTVHLLAAELLCKRVMA